MKRQLSFIIRLALCTLHTFLALTASSDVSQSSVTPKTKPTIAVLNTCCLKEKHFETLRAYGNVTIYHGTNTQKDALERLKDINIAIADPYKVSYNRELFEKTPCLKMLTINAIGYNLVDVTAARQHGISVANIAGFCSDSIAEHTMGLMLAVVRKITLGDKLLRESPFEVNSNNPAHDIFLTRNLRGKTLGIIGLGHSGARVAKLAHAFGMNIVAYNRSPKCVEHVTQMSSLEEVLKASDVISLHVPLTQTTENLIGEKELALMKPSAIIINTARGQIINTQALYNALTNKKIAGAGLDVLTEINNSNPLLTLDTIVFTPHSAFCSQESQENMANTLVQNVISFIQDNPINIVN